MNTLTPAQRAALDIANGVPESVINRRKRRILKRVPSFSWFEAVWYRGEKLPAADARGRVICCICRVPMPRHNVKSSGVCDDCCESASEKKMDHIPLQPRPTQLFE